MTGPQTEIEIRIWCDEVARSMATGWGIAEDAMQRADDLLAKYRLRYGLPQPAADDRIGRAAIEAQEMALWRRVYEQWYARGYKVAECDDIADAAVAAFRKRYPVEPAAPEAVWYDEPPFAKEGAARPCWIAGEPFPCAVYWAGLEWRAYTTGDSYVQRLNGRRVSPIVKPQEPTQ